MLLSERSVAVSICWDIASGKSKIITDGAWQGWPELVSLVWQGLVVLTPQVDMVACPWIHATSADLIACSRCGMLMSSGTHAGALAASKAAVAAQDIPARGGPVHHAGCPGSH